MAKSTFDTLFDIPEAVTQLAVDKEYQSAVSDSLDNVKAFEHLDAFPDQIREIAVYRWKVLTKCLELCGGVLSIQRLTKAYDTLILEFKERTPSISSIRKWYTIYKNAGASIVSLAPSFACRGNRQPRVHHELESLIQQALARIQNANLGSISSAYRYLEYLVWQHNKVSADKLEPISMQAFRKRYIKVTPYDRAICQYGKFKANKLFKHIGQAVKTTRLLERVEIDHTKLDLFVVHKDSGTPLGRPYLTTLMDVHSRSIIGFYIGFTPPSYVAVARALKCAILPKDFIQSRYIDIKNKWIPHGLPELIVSDNGMEFEAETFKLALGDLKINFAKNPTATPYLKPHIERYFGQLNEMFLRGEPGSTNSKYIGEEGYNPAKSAIIDMEELRHKVHIWVIDIYQVSPDARKTRIPNLSWTNGMQRFEPRPCQYDEESLNLVLCQSVDKPLRRIGIELHLLRYSSVALAELWGRKGKHQVRVKYDPDNMGFIYVQNLESATFMKVPAVNYEYASGVTLHQHLQHIKFTKAELGSKIDRDDVIEAYSRIYSAVDKSLTTKTSGGASKKISHTSKGARYLEDSNIAASKKAKFESPTKEVTVNSNETASSIDWDAPPDTKGWESL